MMYLVTDTADNITLTEVNTIYSTVSSIRMLQNIIKLSTLLEVVVIDQHFHKVDKSDPILPVILDYI